MAWQKYFRNVTFLCLACWGTQALAQILSQGDETPAILPTPAKTLPTGRSAGAVIIRNGVISRQVNVDAMGQNIVGDAANEPSLAIDPTNQDRVVIGWRQFDSTSSSFRKAGYAYSHDAGLGWTFPGSIDPATFRSDPVLAADNDGNFYYNSLQVNGGTFSCSVFRSFDGGITWDAGVFAQGGDKQWMCIDQTNGPNQGNIYAVWNSSFSVCNGDFTVSYNGGNTYIDCLSVPSSPRWGTVAVGNNGEVYVSGIFSDGPGISKSVSVQNQVGNPVFEFNQAVNLTGEPVAGAGLNPVGLLGQVYVAVDHSQTATRDNVYLLASVDPGGADPLDVMFSRSEDGGQTWSQAIRINDDPNGSNAWQWFGMMDVAPNGRIDVFWNDTRANPGMFNSELFYAFSTDGGRTWSPNVAVSPSFDPSKGYPQQQKIGDYNDLESGPDGVDVAYTATFNGEQDVYHLRINPGVCPADLNGDLLINEQDLFLAYTHWQTQSRLGDVDESGQVNIVDLLLIQAGQGSCL